MKDPITMTNLITTGISSFLYILFISGLTLVFKDSFRFGYETVRMRNRLKARKAALKEDRQWERHLRKLLNISLKRRVTPGAFLSFTGLIFAIVFIAGMQNLSPLWSFAMSFLISAMPYLLLRVRMETIRRKGSFEGEGLVAEFLSQYRIQEYNIYKTIEHVVLESQGMKTSGKLLFKLLLQIRSTGNPVAIKAATDEFAYGINTNWSRMLANNIRLSAERGTNISFALEDILIQLREARTAAEERKRLNSESVRLVLFVIPAMYMGTILMSVNTLDISLKKFLLNQFYTSQGFLLFTLMVFLFLVNLALVEIIYNQRFDY